MERRGFLIRTLGYGAAVTSLGLVSRQALGQACGRATASQPKGPFYPVAEPPESDTDLTRLFAAAGAAQGQVVYLRGAVRDTACVPVAGAIVEIWQACASGRYNHPGDPNPAPLDGQFQYFGRALTDANGRYHFKTIKPGSYPASGDWERPPHIHFRVLHPDHHELITQLYFEGEPLNATDRILQALSAGDQQDCVRPLTAMANPSAEIGSAAIDFTLTIRPRGSRVVSRS
jgi:protocatechuate 3,4-dioxygenase beta subunit